MSGLGDELLELSDHLLLGGDRRYTQQEVVDKTGVPLEQARTVWRALGFPDVEPEDRVFTDDDVEALATMQHLVDAGIADPEVAVQVARVAGQSMARVADVQMAALRDRLSRAISDAGDGDAARVVTEVASEVLPTNERLLVHVWKRHLVAALRRMSLQDDGSLSAEQVVTVGFADLVGFTAMSQQLDDRELARVVDRFETLAYDTIAERNGRVVKTVGDEVMFVSDEPRAAADIAVTLAEVYKDELSDVRVGLAYGPALAREGDFFGPTVNRASRVMHLAIPGTVLVSEDFHDAVGDHPGLTFRRLRRPRDLKGIGTVPLWVLRRAPQRDP